MRGTQMITSSVETYYLVYISAIVGMLSDKKININISHTVIFIWACLIVIITWIEIFGPRLEILGIEAICTPTIVFTHLSPFDKHFDLL